VTQKITLAKLQSEYRELISRPTLLEEEIHQFLATYPVFLPLLFPWRNTVFSKLSLGNQHRTDFAFTRENTPGMTWHLIELEQPRDRLFQKSGNPSAKLTHAMRQLHEWHTWFIENRDYIARHLPFPEMIKQHGLWNPELILVMGRRSEVSASDKKLMQRLSTPPIQIMTFDRLADRIAVPAIDDLDRPLKCCHQVGKKILTLSEMYVRISYEVNVNANVSGRAAAPK
jgi:hypothetical protein